MSALNSSSTLAINSALREMVAEIFWDWYDVHLHDTVLRKRVIWFDVSIKVKDLHGLFEQLVGSRGQA